VELNAPSNKNLEIAEDVAGVAGQQNAAPPWGFVLQGFQPIFQGNPNGIQ